MTLRGRRIPIGSLAFMAVAIVWIAFLRPLQLGGTTGYVLVGGDSMVPTYGVDDMVVTRPAATYQPGDVIVYRIPAGEPGAGELIVHRIVAGDGSSGFTTQGDHNGYTDVWHPRAVDIVGSPVFVARGAAMAIAVARSPAVAASFAAAITLLWLWRSRPPTAPSSIRSATPG